MENQHQHQHSQMESSRKKSCRQCRLAKTRCSLDTPCSRCDNKKLACKYESKTAKRYAEAQAHNPTISSLAAGSNSAEVAQEAPGPVAEGNGLLTMMNFSSGVTDLSALDISPIPTSDNSHRTEVDWHTNGMGWTAEATWVEEQPREYSMPSGEVQDTILATMEKDFQESLSWLEFGSGGISSSLEVDTTHNPRFTANPDKESRGYSCHSSLTVHRSSILQANWDDLKEFHDNASNLFNRKRAGKISSSITGNAVWASIKIYASDFAGGILPPFIHRRCGDKEWNTGTAESAELPEPLANCSTIISLYQKRSPGNTALVFKTLLLEIRRLYDQFGRKDEKILLQALQALTLYMIAVATDKYRSGFISLTLRIIMEEMAIELCRYQNLNIDEAQAGYLSWQKWIQVESIRRTLLLIQLLDQILDTNIENNPPTGCPYIDDALLPCSSRLWKADTRPNWEREYSSYLLARKDSSHLTVKSLRESCQLQIQSEESQVVQDVLRWSEGVDEFGSMLLMALPDFSNYI